MYRTGEDAGRGQYQPIAEHMPYVLTSEGVAVGARCAFAIL